MPVGPEIAESNRSSRERLARLVRRLDASALRRRLPHGWTVADHLGHIAFWDRQRLCLLRLWAAGDRRGEAYEANVFNDAIQPLLALIPPERIGEAALKAAEEVDAFLLELPDETIQAALARPDAPHVDRGEHRRHHLDQIEEALSASRG